MNSWPAWRFVCELDDILPEAGVAALHRRHSRSPCSASATKVFALDNFDPQSGANVLSRGIVGDVQGELVVASPMYKHHFSLITGRCLEDPEMSGPRVSGASQPTARMGEERAAARIALGPAQAGGDRQRHGGNESGRGIARDRTEGIRDHRLRRRTASELQPHAVVARARRRETGSKTSCCNSLDWYRDKGVTLHTERPRVAIDRRRRVVRSRSGVELPYERLLIATGSKPIVLPVPGNELPGVVTFRDLQDVDAMLAARAHTARRS